MKAHVNGIDLFYEKVGEGDPLLMLHGNGEDHTIFDRAAEELSGRFTCYLPDSRGHGLSSPAETLSYEMMAQDMTELVESAGLQGVTVYGFSDGGILALLMAMKRPAWLRRVIISGANLEPRGLKAGALLQIRLENRFRPDPKLELMLREPHIRPDELKAVSVSALVLAGQHDLIREKHTRLIAASIPGARLQILPGEDHGSYIVHSGKIARIILREAGKGKENEA